MPPCLIELRSRQLGSLPGCLLFNSRQLRRTAENLRRSHSRPRALPDPSACLCHRMRSAGRLRRAMVLLVFHSAGGHALPETSCGVRVYVPIATACALVAECCRGPHLSSRATVSSRFKKPPIFNSGKIHSSCREKPFETVWGEHIPSVFFIFRSNITLPPPLAQPPHLRPQRRFYSGSCSQRSFKVSDLWSR